MKITSLYPIYLADKELVQADVDALKQLGFEEKHHLTEIDGTDVHVLTTGADTRVDIFSNDKVTDKPGLFGLRVNVDNLDEVVAFAETIGFKRESDVYEANSSRSIYMQSSTGLKVWFIEHIK